MGMSWAEHTVEIEAPVEVAFDAIVDYESFPRWQNAVDSVEVRTRTPEGLGEEVQLFVDAKVRRIDYVLRYSYERPTRIEWEFIEGNGMRDVDGVYTLEAAGPERCHATYRLGADPEIPVPGMVAKRVHKQLVKRSVEDLKREAELRHSRGEPAAERAEPGEWEPRTADPDREWADAGWKPKAEREPVSGDPYEPRDGGEDPFGDLAERGLAAAEEVARASGEAAKSAAKLGIAVARDVAGRVDRALSGRDGASGR